MPASESNFASQPISRLDAAGDIYQNTAPTLRDMRLQRDRVTRLLRMAQLGDPVAQRQMGLAYCRGLGVERNGAYAFKWLTLASEQADKQAQRALEILIVGLSGEEMAEGRRLIARDRGEPEPEFGFADACFTSVLENDAEVFQSSSQFKSWTPSELESDAEASSAVMIPALTDQKVLPSSSTMPKNQMMQQPVSVPKITRVSRPAKSWAFVTMFALGVSAVLLATAMVWFGRPFLNATAESADSIADVETAQSVDARPLLNTTASIPSPLTVESVAMTEVVKLTPLSEALPASIRHISPGMAAEWRDLESLRARAVDEDAGAQFDLAQYHLLQAQNTNDFAEAVRLLKLASSSGLVHALNNLGFCHVTGTGTPQDYVEAYKCFALAAARGLKGAQANRDRAAAMLSSTQLAEASGRVAEVVESHRPQPDLLPLPEALRLPPGSSLATEVSAWRVRP